MPSSLHGRVLLVALALLANAPTLAHAQSDVVMPVTPERLRVLSGVITPTNNGRLAITEPLTRALMRLNQTKQLTMDISNRRLSAWTRAEGSSKPKRRIGFLACYIDACNTDMAAIEYEDDLKAGRIVYYKSLDFNFINDKGCKPVRFEVKQSNLFSMPADFSFDLSTRGDQHVLTARLRNVVLESLSIKANGYCEQFGVLADNISLNMLLLSDGKPSDVTTRR